MAEKFINRELSWIEFNQRVLNEAARVDLPLLERLKFLAITASNLDEFYQVRVGGLTLMQRNGIRRKDPSGLTPSANLRAIHARILKFVADQYALLNDHLLPRLIDSGIQLVTTATLDDTRAIRLSHHFDDQISPLLTPLAIVEDEPAPVLPGLTQIVICRLTDPLTGMNRHALIPIPESLPRFIPVPDESTRASCFVPVENLVSTHAARLFPGETLAAASVFRATRNGDIVLRDDDSSDLADDMEDVLTARRFSDTIRLELPGDAPRDLSRLATALTGVSPAATFRVPGITGLASLMDLAFLHGFDHLRSPDWSPHPSPDINPGDSIFDTIASGDLLLHHPYESFEPVLQLIEQAAADPNVLAIKQVLYRTAKKSRIIDALIKAAENGKHVTALVELKARFDEARNLDRADELQRAGAQIVYGVKGLKTHAKICMIVRREQGSLRRYVHLGTGNYNESTARLYTDISYLTCKPEYGNDASLFFNAVTGRSKLVRFQKLVPAPTAMKPTLLDLIATETEQAKQGLPASITAKVNSLQDPEIIEALDKAAKAGVSIRLNVRGICCLKPADARQPKAIRVISIIDRYLEHARIFHFHHSGDAKVYIASADWMTRNLDKRVELMIPIEESAPKRRLIRILDTFFKDNTQASLILPDGSSAQVTRAKGEKPFRAQEHFHNSARQNAKAREHERSMTFEPHVPAQ